MLLLLPIAFAAPGTADPDPTELPTVAELRKLARTPVVLDLWRGWEGADKVFVEAGLPDGSTGLFLLDTGAAISVLNQDTADRLGVQAEAGEGRVAGLSGSVPWQRAVLDLSLGTARVEGVQFAVGVPGAPENAGVLPVDGILGNNVWSNFTLVVDYPADRAELWQPGRYRARGKGAPLDYQQNHAMTDVIFEVKKDDLRAIAPVRIEVDTGAEDTSLWCQTGEPFRPFTSLGVEAVFGIGADLDRVPDFQFLTETRRIPVVQIEAGGRKIPRSTPIRWSSPDTPADACNVTPGLLGYRAFGRYRLVMDYAGGRVTFESPRKHRRFDAQKAWLEQDIARFGDDPARALDRVPVLAASGDMDGARALLTRALETRPDDADLVVLAARLDRAEHRDAEAIARLGKLAPAVLAEKGEWVPLLGALQTSGRGVEALAMAEAAVLAGSDDDQIEQDFLVGLSDCLLGAGRAADALHALDKAIAVDRGGSGFLFRRAILALADGDRYAAVATLRSLLDVYPVGGQAMWLYALSLEEADRTTFIADLDHAVGRLHPGTAPLDFVGASLRVAGAEDRGRTALDEGYARDCKPLRKGPDRDNCEAWYWALGGDRLEEASARIARAIAKVPDNSAFRDTAAVVAWVRGDYAEAAKQAAEAARLSPGDPYLIWQALRMREEK